jgi:hypothetical protein
MTYSAFITDFLRETQLPRLSAQEPVPDKRQIQRIAEIYRRAAANSLAVASHPIWDPLLVTVMVKTSRTASVTEELRGILTIEFEVLLQFLSNPTEPGNLV